jgi:hypothetical protein
MRYSGPIHGLFKFLDRTYLDDFLSGWLYMNTLQYFAEQELSDRSAEVRGDVPVQLEMEKAFPH